MKLVTFATTGPFRAGVLLDGGGVLDIARIHEFGSSSQAFPSDLKALLAQGLLPELQRQVAAIASNPLLRGELQRVEAIVDLATARLGAPIQQPGLILCSGGAYRDHLREMVVDAHERPTAFIKNSAAVTGPNDPILLPRRTPSMVDWEAEFSLVIGRTCFDVSPDEALDYVAGYTLINDVSARDRVADFLGATGVHAMKGFIIGSEMVLGKQFPSFCPMGPCIVTKDELADPGNVDLTTTVNGEVMQSANTRDLIHSVSVTLSYFSQWYRFQPGDILTTGSPSGIGYAQNPQRFLRAGDVVEVRVPQIGAMRNVVQQAHGR